MAAGKFGFAGIVTEKLTEENYENWKECLKSYFKAQGLWDVVTGKEAKPEDEDEDETSPKYQEWMRKNAMALHAIQVSCEADTMSKLRGHESAEFEWKLLAEKRYLPVAEGKCVMLVEVTSEITEYRTLYKAVEQGDWDTVRDFIHNKLDAVRAKITLNGDTALHVAVMAEQSNILKKLIHKMSPQDLELQNEMGYTAFSIAAINGFQEMADKMLDRNPDLVKVKDHHGLIPIVVASLYSSKEMVRYLYKKTPHEMLTPDNPDGSGATLLNCLLTDEIYDVALHLLQKHPLLGFVEDIHGNYTIRLLAHKPSAFASGNKYAFLKRWIYSCISVEAEMQNVVDTQESSDEENITRSRPITWLGQAIELFRLLVWNLLRCFVPDLNHLYHKKLRHAEAQKILKCIIQEIPKLSNSQLERIGLNKAIYDAIKNGITEFVDEMIETTPEIIWRKDEKGRTIFAHAIVRRQEKIFSHVFGLGAKRRIAVIRHDIFHNNFLHLAAKLSPPSRLDRISGAALQMQRELEWFEEVQRILPPKYMEEVNENNKTPGELFTKEHFELVKEGERWMKNTAASCMVVATLIAAVMFTSAFTFPGGNEEHTGIPIFLEYGAFLIFMISNALSLFSSSTSVLVFLGILTSRYAEKDFRRSLPTKLIIGLFTLFFSIVTMMAAFGSAISIILRKRLDWIAIPIILLSAVPIGLFALFQFPLLVEVLICTYGGSIFNKH
ncbi:hypothetical protein Dsin_016372 [Dipteronia sinensis]|uniref:PGG domain-containing protein n=1 Tax=Dipteronia sinensis TaxID=43782 RepID=A0AAE0ADL7_9ROSI|nr:hypothetical protein Dsin_016372 [Dipteronia sinensis]